MEVKKKTLFFGADHKGYRLKSKLIEEIVSKKLDYIVEDVGTNSESSCHYPLFAQSVCKKLQASLLQQSLEEGEGGGDFGILICQTGIGMSIAANRYQGIRAAVCSNTTMSCYARAHNNANILCLGAGIVGDLVSFDIFHIFVTTSFEGSRHRDRLDMIDPKNGKEKK